MKTATDYGGEDDGYLYDDIPIITDAEVVVDDNDVTTGWTVTEAAAATTTTTPISHSNPPAMNPNYKRPGLFDWVLQHWCPQPLPPPPPTMMTTTTTTTTTSPMMVNTILPTATKNTTAIVPFQQDAEQSHNNFGGGTIVPYTAGGTATTTTVMVPNKVTTTVVVPPNHQTMTRLYTSLGRNPTGLQCPYCGRQMVTTIQDMIGVGTIFAVVVVAILFWPLCWIPLLVPSCKRTSHYCGHIECRKKVGETRACA